MAGDWIKIELELPDKPEVHQIANILGIDPDAVLGKLFRVWGWFDKHTKDGNAHGVTFPLLDRITGVSGFGEAMKFAGWLEQNDVNLSMPKFDRHTSKSAKSRATTGERVKRHRNAECNADTVTKPLPEKRREEKRRDIKTPHTPPGGFDVFWQTYPKKIGKGAAETAWNKAKVNGHLSEVLSALEQQKVSSAWTKDNGQYIPNPATWINQRRWEDDLSSQAARAKTREELIRAAL